MRYRIGVKIAIIDLQAVDLAGEAGDHGATAGARRVVAKHAGVEMQSFMAVTYVLGGRGGWPRRQRNDRLLQWRNKGG